MSTRQKPAAYIEGDTDGPFKAKRLGHPMMGRFEVGGRIVDVSTLY